MKVGSRLAGVLLTIGAAVGFAAPAQAADGWVYVVVNNAVCSPYGGQVRGILMNNVTTGWTTTAWDMGDNIIYPKVRLRAYNQLSAQARCQKKVWWGWQDTGFVTLSKRIYPSSTGQTFWMP